MPKVSDHVFKEDCSGFALGDDALDCGPEVSRVVCPELASGDGVGLAGVSRNEEIHDSTPRLAVEGSGVCPQRRVIQPPVASRRDQKSAGRGFVFHITDCASLGESQSNAPVEASSTGCDRQDSGTCNHIAALPAGQASLTGWPARRMC